MRKTKQQVRDDINNERVSATLGEIEFSLGRVAMEVVVAFVYGYAIGSVTGLAIDAIMLLGTPWFVQFAFIVGAVFVAFGVVLTTTTWVVPRVCNAIDAASEYTKLGFTKAKNWVNDLTPDGFVYTITGGRFDPFTK